MQIRWEGARLVCCPLPSVTITLVASAVLRQLFICSVSVCKQERGLLFWSNAFPDNREGN